jgi:hypothetical protein
MANMTKRSDKVLKRKQKKQAHEQYLKSLFTKHGWGVKITSKREPVGTLYLNRGIAESIEKEAKSND